MLAKFESIGGMTLNFSIYSTEPPEIVNVTGNQYVCVGFVVTLSCKATGNPIPNITWTRVWENGTDSEELPSMDGFYFISNNYFKCCFIAVISSISRLRNWV